MRLFKWCLSKLGEGVLSHDGGSGDDLDHHWLLRFGCDIKDISDTKLLCKRHCLQIATGTRVDQKASSLWVRDRASEQWQAGHWNTVALLAALFTSFFLLRIAT